MNNYKSYAYKDWFSNARNKITVSLVYYHECDCFSESNTIFRKINAPRIIESLIKKESFTKFKIFDMNSLSVIVLFPSFLIMLWQIVINL